MHLNYEYERLIIDNCKEMLIQINVILIKNKIKSIVRAFIAITISSYSIIIILIRLRKNTSLFDDCDFMFISYQQISNRFDLDNEILSHIIDVNFSMI